MTLDLHHLEPSSEAVLYLLLTCYFPAVWICYDLVKI